MLFLMPFVSIRHKSISWIGFLEVKLPEACFAPRSGMAGQTISRCSMVGIRARVANSAMSTMEMRTRPVTLFGLSSNRVSMMDWPAGRVAVCAMN
jgi:hypothetical protein